MFHLLPGSFPIAVVTVNFPQVHHYTGLKDGNVFKALLKYLRSQYNATAIKYAVTSNLVCSLTYEDQLLITLKKFRLDQLDETIATDYQVKSEFRGPR